MLKFITILPLFQEDSVPGISNLLDAAKSVDKSDGGYTFAVVLLTFVILVLLYVARILWNKITDKDEKYMRLAESTTAMITEVNMKLDNQDEIKKQLERVIDKIQELRR